MTRWNDKLLSPARALDMAGDWPLTATYELAELSQYDMENGTDPLADQWQINLRCATVRGWKFDDPPEARRELPPVACGQSCGMLAAGGQPYTTTPADLLAGVVRHMVMAHNLSLSGDRNDQAAGDG